MGRFRVYYNLSIEVSARSYGDAEAKTDKIPFDKWDIDSWEIEPL